MNIEKIEINRHYVWVDKDDEIKEGDYVLSKLFEIVKFGEKYTPSLYKKIIAASPELNLEGVPTYVEWLAEQEYIKGVYVINGIDIAESSRECFIKGYQTAEKELPTWDDVRFIILKSFLLGVDRGEYSKEFEDKIIEQLKQNKK